MGNTDHRAGLETSADDGAGDTATLPRTVTECGPVSAIHELRQALNVVRLTAGNIGMRLLPKLDAEGATYLRSKLQVIEAQIELLSTMSDRICDPAAADR